MKKYVATCATLAALAWVGVAAADTPQGKLDGAAVVGTAPELLTFAISSPVIDGGDTYVGLENDRSGNCNGDSGTIFQGQGVTVSYNVVCAHYIASSRDGSGQKMRLALKSDLVGCCYDIVRITDNGDSPDTWAEGYGGPVAVTTLAEATAWVNTGRIGGGFAASFFWVFKPMVVGNYTITAQQ